MKQRASSVIMSLSVQFGALRSRELRELLEDEDKINHIIRCSDKFQGLQRAAEKMLVSNQKMAKVGLSHKPQFRDAKLLLAMKYKELEKLRSIIQVKQEQLGEFCLFSVIFNLAAIYICSLCFAAEKYSLHYAQWCLLKKINHAEEECELLFQRFAEGKTPLANFLESFLSSRKLQHIRSILVKKLQDTIELKSTQIVSEIHPDTFPERVHNACLPVCGLTTAVLLPACCHQPPFLLPFGTHVNAAQCLQHVPFCHDYTESLRAGVHGRGLKWPARPVRLQPLKVQQRRQQHGPQ
ncbi:vacuolar protein sorting-associated protein 37D-like isoform X1 [Dicentrarchus labrax]|uniref:vacuolar protein sorting-associated protein 37D-like isoform X1 n=1 Tax=Dicentrarchus labrax TaxID=13489 RepID=UPI0021F6343E|nr:vacuolar protein sorting-associated protein 37D-like isoform X1 [Dicentrarchus labrax]